MRGNDKREDGQEISALCPSPYQCSQQHRFGSLCQLWSRLDTTCLPHRWLEHPDARLSNSLLLSSYRNNSLFLVTVNRHLECCVTCSGQDISQCNVLQNIPTHINNLQYLRELLDIITNCHFCCGNHLEQFHDVLSEEEKHVTNTAIGKKTNYNKCVMNLASFHSILQEKTLFINHAKADKRRRKCGEILGWICML